jgi:hypothetical protein
MNNAKNPKKTIDKIPNPCYNVYIRKRETKERKTMKAYRMMVTYGKSEQYVASNWVVESAIEQYKEEQTKAIRNRGWKKEIGFKVYENTFVELGKRENGLVGTIYAYTTEGFKSNVEVK